MSAKKLGPAPMRESHRRRANPGKRITVILPPDLVKSLRVAAAREDCSVSHAVTELVREWVQARGA